MVSCSLWIGVRCILGCLAVALAEVLNVFPVLFRRANLKNGLGFLITAFAAGKTVGGLVYFFLDCIRRKKDL